MRLAPLFILLTLLSGCASRLQTAEDLAARHQRRSEIISTPLFDLYSVGPARLRAGHPLIAYIEGDGDTWINPYRLSPDPTPIRPLGLELAMQDPRPNVVYIARPCQYVTGAGRRNCQPGYWDTAAYHDDVISSFDAAISILTQRSGLTEVIYVGYSGGGAVAALVAARRKDSAGLITLAGVLDHRAWTRQAELQPLAYSINPPDYAEALVTLPQIHYSGADDDIVPTAQARSYAARFPNGRRPRIEVIRGFDHGCCWSDKWRGMATRPLPVPAEP